MKNKGEITSEQLEYFLGSDNLSKNKLLEDDGILIVEHAKQTDLSHLEYYSYSKNYGGSVFSFFEIGVDADE